MASPKRIIVEVDKIEEESPTKMRFRTNREPIYENPEEEKDKEKVIRMIKYVDEDEAKYKLKNCLFNPQAKLDQDLLCDDKIFYMLQKDLKLEHIEWIKKQRVILLDKIRVSSLPHHL